MNYLFSHHTYCADIYFCSKNFNYQREMMLYNGSRELVFVVKGKDSYTYRQGHLYYSPHPKSRASLLLLNESLKRQEMGLCSGEGTSEIFWSNEKKHTSELNCYYCNVDINDENESMDHFIPQSRGGENKFHNLKVSCKICNHIKADMHPQIEKVLYNLFLEYVKNNSLKKGSQEKFLIDCINKGFSKEVSKYLEQTNQRLIKVKESLNDVKLKEMA